MACNVFFLGFICEVTFRRDTVSVYSVIIVDYDKLCKFGSIFLSQKDFTPEESGASKVFALFISAA